MKTIRITVGDIVTIVLHLSLFAYLAFHYKCFYDLGALNPIHGTIDLVAGFFGVVVIIMWAVVLHDKYQYKSFEIKIPTLKDRYELTEEEKQWWELHREEVAELIKEKKLIQ